MLGEEWEIKMHVHTLENWQHNHDFLVKNEKGERRTQYVLILKMKHFVKKSRHH